jgi:drug/metabolite transporter (DMT)-like permease
VSAGVFGYFFAGEVLSGSQLAGAVLILSGMLLAEVGSYIALWIFKKKHAH